MTNEGKSKEEIINYLNNLNIERLDTIPHDGFTKTTDKKEYKAETPVLYTADALHLLTILKEISKQTHSNHLLHLGNDIVEKYFSTKSEQGLFLWVTNYLDEKQIANQTFYKQCLKHCCDLLIAGKKDSLIIQKIVQHYAGFKVVNNSTLMDNPVVSHSVEHRSHRVEEKEIVIKEPKIKELFDTCKRISNNMFASTAEHKLLTLLQDAYNRYEESDKELSFMSFLKLDQGCDVKHKDEYKLLIDEYENLLNKNKENNIFDHFLGPNDTQKKPIKCPEAKNVINGLHIRKNEKDLWGCSLNNRWILKQEYRAIRPVGENHNYLIVQRGNLFGMFFIQGGQAHPYLQIKYRCIKNLYHDNYLIINRDSNCGIIKLGSENKFIAEPIYTEIEHNPSNAKIVFLKRKGKQRRLVLK